MTLKERLDQDIKEAMKAKDAASLRALRALKAAVLLAETAEGHAGTPLSEPEEMQLVQRQVRQRRDSIEQFRANNRPDLAQTEEEEIAVLQRYLPAALSEEALRARLQEIITREGATGPKDMGRVMKAATAELAGQAEGGAISQAVKQMLGNA